MAGIHQSAGWPYVSGEPLALKLAGVDKNTKDVPGGVIVRDAKGNPTGILKDAATSLVEQVIPPPSQDQIHRIREPLNPMPTRKV